MSVEPRDERLFVYGMLQDTAVRSEVFGRVMDGEEAILTGHRIEWARGEGPLAIDPSGPIERPSLRRTGAVLDKVFGEVVLLTEDELEAVDGYVFGEQVRVRALLADGSTAWVYIGARHPSGGVDAD